MRDNTEKLRDILEAIERINLLDAMNRVST